MTNYSAQPSDGQDSNVYKLTPLGKRTTVRFGASEGTKVSDQFASRRRKAAAAAQNRD